MKIKATNAKTINDQPVKAGDIVEVDRATARNLINKGFAEAHDAEAKGLKLETRSVVSKSVQKIRIERTLEARERRAKELGEDLALEIAA